MQGALAAAVAVLFNDPNGATDGVFTPLGGQPVPVRVIRSSTYDRVAGGIGAFGSQAESNAAEIQVSQVPQRPLKTATIFYDGRTRSIAEVAPARNGLTWLLGLAA